MELIESGEDSNEMDDLTYEKVNDFKYLGATLSTKIDWYKEISIRINKAQKVFYALKKFLTFKMLSRRTKLRLLCGYYKTDSRVWLRSLDDNEIERNLRTLENIVWRKICGPSSMKQRGTCGGAEREKPRRRPKKRWIDVVEGDLKTLGVENWKKTVQDRDRLRSVVMATKTLRE
ncbi:Hypothetical protein CINCED_3A006720 [Cinara cedri]|uniref:Reverse transcriptase domain n=1 Tax=Cinara cedri TaxID=506608 RepID=A0A5E4ME68_9HEMI|nr:Hypothetical protein CINCED_3A006720 [Cinara cedri]